MRFAPYGINDHNSGRRRGDLAQVLRKQHRRTGYVPGDVVEVSLGSMARVGKVPAVMRKPVMPGHMSLNALRREQGPAVSVRGPMLTGRTEWRRLARQRERFFQADHAVDLMAERAARRTRAENLLFAVAA